MNRPDYLSELLDLLEADAIMMLGAYFDESGTHQGSPITCVAGYVFKRQDALRFSRSWGKVLRANGLPYFRMSECAHGFGHFTDKSMEERVRVETKLIELVKLRALFGIAITVCESDFVKVASPAGSPYALCLLWCLTGISAWIAKYKFKGKISYFFEAGHPRQPLVNRAMHELSSKAALREEIKYHSHVFAGKNEARPLQAADLLAWLWFKDRKDQLLGTWKDHRKDLTSLMGLTHMHAHFGPEDLHRFANHDPTLPMPIRVEEIGGRG